MRWIIRGLIVVYLIVGILVANANDYFKNVDDIQTVLSAVLAVIAWPLVLLDVDLHFGDEAKMKKKKDGGKDDRKNVLLPALWGTQYYLRRFTGKLGARGGI